LPNSGALTADQADFVTPVKWATDTELAGVTHMARLLVANSLNQVIKRLPLLRPVLWVLEAMVIGIPLFVARMLSPERASALGRRIFRAIGPRLDKTRIFRRNLILAFPEKSAQEIEILVRDIWGNVGAVLAEYPHLPAYAKPGQPERLDIIIHSDSPVFRRNGKPAVFVSAHLANWEIPVASALRLGIPVSVLYTPLQNPWLDRMLYKARTRLGVNMLARDGSIRTLVRELGSGRSIGMLVDQRVDAGEPVPFFGLNMNTSTTPARLALRYRCDLIPVHVRRFDNARFQVIFEPPVIPATGITDEHEKILDMTRQVNALFEVWIREQPQEWLCSKRRWAKDAEPARSPAVSGTDPDR
jgi:KDO2-lipid IV(A) lauroyltransferase